MARGGNNSIPGNAADPDRITGKTGGKVTGWDYQPVPDVAAAATEPDDDDFLCDTDLPGGLIVENAFGGPYGDGSDRGPDV